MRRRFSDRRSACPTIPVKRWPASRANSCIFDSSEFARQLSLVGLPVPMLALLLAAD
jgi:hypothetical protein